MDNPVEKICKCFRTCFLQIVKLMRLHWLIFDEKKRTIFRKGAKL